MKVVALCLVAFLSSTGMALAREVHVENGVMVYVGAPEGGFLIVEEYNGRPYVADAATAVGPGCRQETIPNQNDPEGEPVAVTFCDGVSSVDVLGTDGFDNVELRTSLPGRATLGGGVDTASHHLPNFGGLPTRFTSPVSIDGGPGNDRIQGGDGPDTITGGPGGDTLLAHGGADNIFARDGEKDGIACGSGNDTLQFDLIDAIGPVCEGYSPRLGLETSVPNQKLGRVLKRGLKVKASSSPQSTLRLTLKLKKLVVGTARAQITSKTRTVTVKVNSKGKAALRKRKRASLSLKAFAQTSNDEKTGTRNFTLRR